MKVKTIYLVVALAVGVCLTGCSWEVNVNGQPEPHAASKNDIEAGRRLIASYGCGSCHTIPGVPGANGKVAPPLDGFYERSYIAGRLPNTEENLVQWIQHPQQIDPGTAMPDMGVSEDEARTIAVYLYHQQSVMDWLRQ